MSECTDPEGSLPALKLRNKPEGKGPLGNQFKGRMLYTGPDRKALVEKLQDTLIRAGEDVGPKGVDGKFGDDTESAVKEFQNDHKDWEDNPLKVDGLVGPRTSDALNRRLVGDLFNCYLTPKELTQHFLLATVTRTSLESGLSFDINGEKKVKLVTVDLVLEHVITLLDSNRQPLSFTGDAQFRVVDLSDNELGSGTVQSGQEISIRTPGDPAVVHLTLPDKTISLNVKTPLTA